METKHTWTSYDWIKLLAALILLFLLILLVMHSYFVKSAPAQVPPYPAADFSWNEDKEILFNPQGTPVYMLTTDGKRWQPMIPAKVQTQLPQQVQLYQNTSGDWIILDEKGQILATLNHITQQWQVKLNLAELAPSATLLPTATPTKAPTNTATLLPQNSATPTPTEALQPTGTVIAGCPVSMASQLAIGDTAVARANVYLRRTPYVGDNVISYNVVGAKFLVLDGPQCVAHDNGYYIWWLVESPYGQIGWSAENTLFGKENLLVPLP
jgi:hypothetical protein